MSIAAAFRDALSNVYGPATNFIASAQGALQFQIYSNVVAATSATAVSGTYSVVYGYDFSASTSGAVDLSFVDATATATGTAPKWRVVGLPAGGISKVFQHPLRFDKGIVLSYTATAANTLSANVQWGVVGPGY